MPVAHQAAAARLGLEIGMSMQEITDLRLNGFCQQGTCPAAQNLGERIREGPWLRKLENVTVDHGVSLLRWRSGGVEHPHDTPPYPLMPSPTFALSSANGPAATKCGSSHFTFGIVSSADGQQADAGMI